MSIEEDKLQLTQLIDLDTLQTIQDIFSEITNMVIGISDADGVLVTKDTNSTDFCLNYNKKSPIGRKRCEQCDKQGAYLALKEGKSVTYHCHAGLVDFAAPIMAQGELIGCITGGQVRTEELDEDRLRQVAKEIEVDPDEYVEAAKKIRYVEADELDRATRFLYQMSTIISNMAYDRYRLIHANREIEHSARMKSDFLANMSHEIRTPMNAVIGMAEMALREEDLPPAARGYISQIISSGKTLLTIINDILDFSKIEAGKMTIDAEEYEPMSIINDVANIINTRIGEKDLELILDIAPNLPNKLIGDSDRLKQIIINLANNAVKFTKRGQVVLHVDFEKTSKDSIELQVDVQDTGIGIKKDDLAKIFNSFQQVDSKRNRNIEGTGLGLAICQSLVTMMGGDIWAASEYNKGSTFFFRIPQKIADETPSVAVRDKEQIAAAGLVANGFLRNHIEKDMKQLEIPYVSLESEEELQCLVEQRIPYFFVGQAMFSLKVQEFVKQHPEITVILMMDFRNSMKVNIENVRVVKKPIYVLNIASILNGEEVNTGIGYSGFDDFEFVAPEAEILIVDDNAINLTVAEGLLKPLQMKIDTATGAKETIAMISKKKYDLIFMDHMMPDIDGVETTHIIRRFYPDYEDVPIIALTANAVSGTKELFLAEGMNDFVAKPIEMRNILSKLRNWLPKEKIQKITASSRKQMEKEEAKSIVIEGLDVDAAMKLLGNEKLFWAVLKDYYQVIHKKANIIKQYEVDEDWHAYTIEVHALKSASRQVGALTLSEKAARLEQAGHEEDSALIHQNTDEMLEQYLGYIDILKVYFPEELQEKVATKEMSAEELSHTLSAIKEALEDLDMDTIDGILETMQEYKLDAEQEKLRKELKEAVSGFDADTCEDVVHRWEQYL